MESVNGCVGKRLAYLLMEWQDFGMDLRLYFVDILGVKKIDVLLAVHYVQGLPRSAQGGSAHAQWKPCAYGELPTVQCHNAR